MRHSGPTGSQNGHLPRSDPWRWRVLEEGSIERLRTLSTFSRRGETRTPRRIWWFEEEQRSSKTVSHGSPPPHPRALATAGFPYQHICGGRMSVHSTILRLHLHMYCRSNRWELINICRHRSRANANFMVGNLAHAPCNRSTMAMAGNVNCPGAAHPASTSL